MNSFFTLHIFLEVGKTQDLPRKIWQTLGDALTLYLVQHPWKSKIKLLRINLRKSLASL
jgi:hypothetical protein